MAGNLSVLLGTPDVAVAPLANAVLYARAELFVNAALLLALVALTAEKHGKRAQLDIRD